MSRTAQVWAGILGFAFAAFAVAWAWINYPWFASAYDTGELATGRSPICAS